MQGTIFILENHVHILKYFIQLKYYTVNCLQHAGVWVSVCVCVFVYKIQTLVRYINGQSHRVCIEMPMTTC